MTPQEPGPEAPGKQPADLALLIQQARASNEQALKDIYLSMLPRVIGLVRQKMAAPASAVSASDIAQSVLASFFIRFDQGKFPDLRDGNSLWWLLAKIACRKVANVYRRRKAQRRGGEFTRVPDGDEASTILTELVTKEPDHTCIVEVQELLEKLQELLKGERQAQVVTWHMDGWTNAEIARKLNVSASTVEEYLRTVRRKWNDFASAQGLDDLIA